MAIVTLSNGTQFDTESTSKKSPVKSQLNGVILYEGSSVLDGAPIVAIATFNSKNEKTGTMVQTWIMRSDVSPTEASKASLDSSVCGMCPHRQSLGGACYVTLHQAPLSVWKAYKRGNYEVLNNGNRNNFLGKSLRIGSYGDPAAIPANVWESLLPLSTGWTGYTHQHKHPNFNERIATFCMISVDTEKEAKRVQAKGYKTFRVKTEEQLNMPSEITCLNTSHNLSCKECGLCNSKQVNITIDVHGQRTKRFYEKFGKIL